MTARQTPAPASFGASEHTNTNGTGRLLTAEDLAARWQVKTSQVYRLTREGALPTVKLGRYYRYRLEAVDRFECEGGLSDG